MSHITTTTVQILDIDTLEAAAHQLGLVLNRGQQTYRWWGRTVGDYPIPAGFTADDLGRCDHAICVPDQPGAYEIGVVQRRDGQPGWQLMYDFYAGGYGLMERVGENAHRLLQEIAVATLQRRAQTLNQHFEVRRLPNGVPTELLLFSHT